MQRGASATKYTLSRFLSGPGRQLLLDEDRSVADQSVFLDAFVGL